MDSNVFTPTLSIPTFHSFPLFPKQSHFPTRRKPHHYHFTIKSSHKPLPPPPPPTPSSLGFPLSPIPKPHQFLNSARKSLALALFCLAVGFLPSHFRPSAAAAAALPFSITSVLRDYTKKKKAAPSPADHEFSAYTQRLLQVVSVLLQRIEDVKSSKADMNAVRDALKEVVSRRKELQEEMLSVLNAELWELRGERAELMKRAAEVIDMAMGAKKERDKLLRSPGGGDKEKVERLEKSMGAAEEEYNGIWVKVGEIEDRIMRREGITYNVGIRELSFIQRESELLVERFKQRLRQQSIESMPKSLSGKLSKSDIQKELEIAQKEYWEQMILPRAVEVEDSEHFMDPTTKEFVLRIKQRFKESRELQRNLESRMRKKMKKYGDEKRFLESTPPDEVVKGFPEVELKWMFGDKEVVVPKAAKVHLLHGWKKWREEAKANLKRELLENVEYGKQYVAQRQERILLDRDRVVAKTWYNDQRRRWEMDPIAVPYAVSKKLIENARIRHDWAAMYLTLKGDDKEYYVDAREFDILFEDFGGFDGLYLKMLSSGIPTSVHLMWIPLSDLDMRQQFLLIWRISRQCLVGLWKSYIVSYAREWCFTKIKISAQAH